MRQQAPDLAGEADTGRVGVAEPLEPVVQPLLAELRAADPEVAPETENMDGIGRFGWVTDPEGNRIELWEPKDQG